MKLLDYEAADGNEGSYNDLIKQLVKKTRFYYLEVSGDDFKSAVPELKAIETKIQRLDRDLGNEHRNYLSEILEELSQENELEDLLTEEFKRTVNILVPKLAEEDFGFDKVAFEFRILSGIPYLKYDGYHDGKPNDFTSSVVKDILKSLCAKHDVIFIDSCYSKF